MLQPAWWARARLAPCCRDAARDACITPDTLLAASPPPFSPRLDDYAHWFPEEATFKPKTLSASRPGSAKGGAGKLSGAGDGETGPARMERLYSSYEKVRWAAGWRVAWGQGPGQSTCDM